MSVRSGSFVSGSFVSGSFALLLAVAFGVQGAAATPVSPGSPRPAPLQRHFDRTAPGPVTGLTVSAVGSRSVALTWTNPADPDLQQVMIRRTVGLTPPATPAEGTLVAVTRRVVSSYTDFRLRPATTYSYALFALDRYRNASAPATVLAVTGNGSLVSGVAGLVTDTAGRPLENVEVRVSLADNSAGFAETDRNGQYRVTGLSPGTVVVCFRPTPTTRGPSPTGYLGQCYLNQPLDWFGAGTPVTVQAGRITHDINGTLSPGGAISGRVTDVNGVGLAGVTVSVCCDGNPVGDPSQVTTASDGSYRMTSLPALSYTVCFDPHGLTSPAPTGYLPECYDNKDIFDGTPVAVQVGHTHAGVNAVLAVGGAITGTVTDEAGVPVQGVFVSAGNGGAFIPSTQTDAAGRYALTGVFAGSYQVCFDGFGVITPAAPYGYSQTCVGDFPSGGVQVVAGQVTPLDGHIARAGAIGGRVTTLGGTPLAGVGINVIDSSGSGEFAAVTDDTGHYLVTGLAPGVWTICFDTTFGLPNFLSECYHDRTVAEGGTPITVTGGTLSTADESLAPAATITGTLTAANGTPLEGVFITATATDGSPFFGFSGADGTYTVGSLLPGTFTVCFDPQSVQGGPPFGYASECFDDQPDANTATPIEVPQSGTTGIDASLAAASGITGTVTGPDGNPLGGVFVSANGVNITSFGFAITDTDGTYRLTGLRAEDYYVCFDPSFVQPQPPTGYLRECYDNQPYAFPSTPVTVAAGAPTTGIDARIEVGTAAVAPPSRSLSAPRATSACARQPIPFGRAFRCA
jgi:protocatechuate 3,4-dioxygenase beta subunit